MLVAVPFISWLPTNQNLSKRELMQLPLQTHLRGLAQVSTVRKEGIYINPQWEKKAFPLSESYVPLYPIQRLVFAFAISEKNVSLLYSVTFLSNTFQGVEKPSLKK